MDSDRTKGKKLDTGFSGTTKQWEETFGTRYWKAGAMYRGSAPSPLTTTPCLSDTIGKEVDKSSEFQNTIQLPQLKVVEVVSNHLFHAISHIWYSFIFYLLHVIGSLPLTVFSCLPNCQSYDLARVMNCLQLLVLYNKCSCIKLGYAA